MNNIDELHCRSDRNVVYSNWSYPDLITEERKFKRLAVLDHDFVVHQLRKYYGRAIVCIANKYVVKVGDHYWYQHDNHTILLEKIC